MFAYSWQAFAGTQRAAHVGRATVIPCLEVGRAGHGAGGQPMNAEPVRLPLLPASKALHSQAGRGCKESFPHSCPFSRDWPQADGQPIASWP